MIHRSNSASARFLAASVAACLVAAAAVDAGAAVSPPPAGARVIDFEDSAITPASFLNATRLTDRYAPVGVVFGGSGDNGGAVLNGSTFSITGESGANFLAFNSGALLSGGPGVPAMPETLTFRHAVELVQMNVAGSNGATLTLRAYDETDTLLGSFDVSLSSTMQTITVDYARMKIIELTATGQIVAIDDVAFLLAPTLVDFDDFPRPTTFVATQAARDEYVGKGVRFRGGSLTDGAAILDEDGAWGNLGNFSAPNILAINSDSFYLPAGQPVFPQLILFDVPVREVSFRAAGSSGKTLQVKCLDANENTVSSKDVTLATSTQMVTLEGAGIAGCELTSPDAKFLVLDDLAFRQEGTVIDFDDATAATSDFGNETALRERYAALGVHFDGGSDDGPAIVDQGGEFGVFYYSPPKFLGWNYGSKLSDGATPSMSPIVKFDRPIKAVQFRAGSPFGGSIRTQGYDVVGNKVADLVAYLTETSQGVWIPAKGATELQIDVSSPDVEYGILDNFAFQFTDPCAHDLCYVGEGLDKYCNACATKVCDTLPTCCTGTWTKACAEEAEYTCSFTCLPLCGDANDDRKLSATDALAALKAAVGSSTCPLYRCDYNGDGSVKSGDALQILKKAVGQNPTAKCPAPVA